MKAPFRIERLAAHDRSKFDCGVQSLNEYFFDRVTQDIRRHVTICFVAIDNDTDAIAGYYTLAASGIALTELPPALAKKLPRYPSVPVVRIGRLAIDSRYQGRKLGGALLFDAISRTCGAEIAAFAVIVDAKDENAVRFYEHHGFQRFRDDPQTLFLPISSALKRQSKM